MLKIFYLKLMIQICFYFFITVTFLRSPPRFPSIIKQQIRLLAENGGIIIDNA